MPVCGVSRYVSVVNMHCIIGSSLLLFIVLHENEMCCRSRDLKSSGIIPALDLKEARKHLGTERGSASNQLSRDKWCLDKRLRGVENRGLSLCMKPKAVGGPFGPDTRSQP